MLDIELLINLEIGIWKIEAEGISCSRKNQRWAFIPNEEIRSTRTRNGIITWEWPIHFAERQWSSLQDIENLMTALALKRMELGLRQNEEMDQNTWEEVLYLMTEQTEELIDEKTL